MKHARDFGHSARPRHHHHGGNRAGVRAAARRSGLGAGAPIATRLTLWAASAGAPVQLSRTESGTDGHFTLRFTRAPSGDSNLYLIATGGEPTANKGSGNNPAIALWRRGVETASQSDYQRDDDDRLGVNDAQFLDGTAIKGHALGLKIAAGSVLNFVSLETGGWGGVIQDPAGT